MAKHAAQGKEFPIFFYGQRYAFEPVETVDERQAGAGAVIPAGLVVRRRSDKKART
jgi:hypothetical protein